MEINNELIDALKKLKKPWHHHPLLASAIPAILVIIIGVWLNTYVQQKFETQEKRTEIILNFPDLADSMRSNSWNIYDAYKLNNEDAKHSTWERGQDLSNKYNKLVKEMKSNFSVTEGDALIKNVREIHKLRINIRNRIKSTDFSQESQAKKLEDYMNAEDGRATELTRDIRQEFKDYIGEIDEETMRMLPIPDDPNTTSSIQIQELPPKN